VKLLSPRNLDEALIMLAEGAARGNGAIIPIAGGTDLMVSWHQRPKDDLTLLDLSRVSELCGVRLTDDALVLGARATYWQVLCDDAVIAAFPLLADAARQVGAIQIQTRGTWAGNIGNGSPAADGVPVLMAYDATVTLASTRGRREVRLDEYYTGYRASVRAADELIVEIRVPRRPRDVQWFHKVGARRAQAITKVGVAMVHDVTGWRVVANSVAPVVCRCRSLEAVLDAGQAFSNPAAVEAVIAKDVSPIDDVRSTALYRRNVLSGLVYYRLATPIRAD
jgi:CO/xanthine dehydrogenase FAD-binding subunit